MQLQDRYRQILRIINRELTLPSPPAVAVQILNSVQKDESALTDLAEIISTDPALTAKMLKIANSGIFACNGEVSNINRAMTVLGTNLIKNVALSFVIASDFNETRPGGFEIDRFWKRSVTAAVAGKLLAESLRHHNEEIFVTALLQDIGMLIISQTKGEEYSRLLRDADGPGMCLTELEKKQYGFNHQQVGYALLSHWNLPPGICEPILYHHTAEDAPEDIRQTAQFLSFSNRLADLYMEPGIAERTRELQAELASCFSMQPQDSLTLLDRIASEARAMIDAFELSPTDIKPYSQLLQEANQELGKLNLSSEQIALEMKEAKEQAERLSRELQDANTRLRELVYRDGLTGLYNHRYFQEALANELARANRYHSSVSLILFDIDHFKKVNDTFGHPAGDLVLMNIASAVSSAVRPSDIVARYGGEEFAVILPETGLAGVKVFAARLRRCVEGIATLVDGQLIYVTVSAGATTFDHTRPVDKDSLIETADRGLYQAKQHGRNQVTILEAEAAEQG